MSAARNYGAKSSNSPWLAFLDSDDEWVPQKLEAQIAYIQKYPEYRFVHTEEIWIRNGVRVNPKQKHKKTAENIFERSLEFCIISPSTSMITRDLFEHYNGFDEKFTVCEDYDLWLKIMSREEIGFVEEPLTKKYGGHEDQLSNQFVLMDQWRFNSLMELFQAKDISPEKRTLIENELLKKSELLIKGYLKHQNETKAQEITTLLNQARLTKA